MVLAELEIRHSRAIAPTRRVAIGELYLPTDPPPGAGGLLLAALVASFGAALPDDERDGVDRLLWDLEHRGRVAQPRLRHRFQSDVVGLDRSRHRVVGDAAAPRLEIDGHGAPLPQVLGAAYAASRLASAVRPVVFRLLRRATRWEGGPDGELLGWLAGDEAALRPRPGAGDEAWALRVLGFASGAEPPRGDILRRFRSLVRGAHPDHGAEADGAGERISELAEAKRILIGG